MKSAKPTAITIVVILLLASAAYWLWQRQPKPQNNEAPQVTTTQKTASPTPAKALLEFTPIDGQVLTDSLVTFNGKSTPAKYIIAYSNSAQNITQSSDKGDFKLNLTLTDGLNLITVSTLDENFLEKDSKQVVIYSNTDKSAAYKTVFAGSVKSIFDNLLTITTATGEKTFRQKTSTKLVLPKNTPPTKQTAKDNTTIRVGDYIIALGSVENEKEFSAETISVIRENKPQNAEKFTDAIILSNAQKNPKVKDQILFSAKNPKENSAVELILGKESKISDAGKDAKEDKIVKDRKALIFFHPQDKDKIADLVYLLP